MQATAQPLGQRRTFSRMNGADGSTVPRLVAAEERHRKNLQQIHLLKQALCSTVGGGTAVPAMTAATARGESLPSSIPVATSQPAPSWMACSREGSNGGVTSPLQMSSSATASLSHRPLWRSAPVSALQESQLEVENLVRERNKLQRQCVEMASLLGDTPHSLAAGAGPGAALAAAAGTVWSPVHEAALAVVQQAAHCYPDAIAEKPFDATATSKGEDLCDSQRAFSSAPPALHKEQVDAVSFHRSRCPPSTAEELVDALGRLAEFLPRLASATTAGGLVAASGSDLLCHAHILEEEKQSDCLAVLSITDHLTQAATQLQREAAEKDEALRVMQGTVENLMEEKAQWARRARASEEALAERYEQYRQHEKAWAEEVSGLLLQSKQSAENALAANTTASAETHIVALEEELEATGSALAALQAEHDALRATHAELQAGSRQSDAAQRKRIAELEGQLHPLEAELQSQSTIIESTLRKVEELSQAHRAQTAALAESHSASLAEKATTVLCLEESKARLEVELEESTAGAARMGVKLAAAVRFAERTALPSLLHECVSADTPPRAAESASALQLGGPVEVGTSACDDGEDVNASLQLESTPGWREGDEDDGTEDVSVSSTAAVDVRRMQQSMKRMSRERAALKRKLDLRVGALADTESKLEAAQRLVAQRDVEVQALTAELQAAAAAVKLAPEVAMASGHDAEAGAPTREEEAVFDWIDFAELERHGSEGSLYPAPVNLADWLLQRTDEATLRFSAYARLHLSHDQRLRLAAVGPLYHIGFSLLEMEGLVPQGADPADLPAVWRRFLIQLQRLLDAQLRGTALSPADSAKCFYRLACRAGCFGDCANASRDPTTAYSVVIAALCVCLREEPSATSSGGELVHPAAEKGGKWRCCQALLRHVCSVEGSEAAARGAEAGAAGADGATPHHLFAALCSATSSVASASGDVGSGGEMTLQTAPCLATLFASDLLSDRLPLSHVALCGVVLSAAAERGSTGDDERSLPAGMPAEAARLALESRQWDLATLLLYLARHEYLLFGVAEQAGAAVSESEGVCETGVVHDANAAPLTLEALGISEVWSEPAAVAATRRSPRTTPADTVTRLLAFLCSDLLPAITVAVQRCPHLDREVHLLDSFFHTRQRLLEKRVALLTGGSMEAATEATAPASSLLTMPEVELRDLVAAALAPAARAVPPTPGVVRVPAAEYERLHRELLSLYETNDAYHRHIQELLGAVEAA
ncbi:hypothetical protein NESM_000437800 [Novymonas esmeraldas]|uniref:Uncharacterized protein n=1 Tax=Novymonas esmeraldas TaxID=1808958 RepID=A0AAW0EP22_9TRYP